MRIETLRILAATACGVALVAFGPRTTARASEDPPGAESAKRPARQALVGQWTLNVDLSEDPREKMREAMEKRMQGGGSGMGRGGGTGRGGSQEGQRPAMMTFFSARELAITHLEPAVSIVEPDGLVRTLQPDGEKYQTEHGEGEVKTRWKGDRLFVETKTERGKMKETWSVSQETGQLLVVLEIEPGGGRMPAVTVNRVYDRADADR